MPVDSEFKRVVYIHFRSLLTGESGKGEALDNIALAQVTVDELNEKYKNIIVHWLEEQ